MTKLPEGWSIATIDHIADINPRHPGDLDDSLQVTFVRMPALSQTVWNFKSTEERMLGQVRRGFMHFAEGDVLFAKITPCMENGKAAIASQLINGLGCGTTELHVLRPLGNMNAKYIYYFIHRDSFREEAARNFTGSAGQLRVPVSFVSDAQIPVPPLGEQRRIVAKLEKLLSRVDAARARLTKIPEILKRFRQSVLTAACSGRLTADWRSKTRNTTPASDFLRPVLKRGLLAPDSHGHLPGWAVCSVDELFESYGGGTPSRRNLDYWNGEVVWVSSGDVKTDIIESSSETITQVGLENSSANLCGVGTVLVVVRSGILKHTLPVAIAGTKLAINQDIKCFDCGNPKLNYWLFLTLKAAAQDILAFNREGTTVQSVKLETLKSFELSIPPLEEQEEIVRRIEAIFKTADALESRYHQAKAHVDRLTQSILHKAFRGELVSQDERDEPAGVLLERIRAEQASQLVHPKVAARAARGIRGTKRHSKGIFYRRAALDCYVIEKLKADPNLGRTKMEKLSHLLEHHCGIDLEREPIRDAAGPNDYSSRINVESLARKQNWYFTRTRKGGAKIDYLPGPEILKSRRTAINFLGYRKTKVDSLLSLLRPLDTKKAEVVATLYASWNDFLLAGKTPTEDELINDVRNNWHPTKQLIPIEWWTKSLDWMRGKQLIPTGTGRPVTHKVFSERSQILPRRTRQTATKSSKGSRKRRA